MFSLAAFRAVQGLGAGGLFSLALAIIGDIVPPRERAKYQGYFLAVFGTSSVLGPVVGGFFAGQDDHPRHHRLALGLPRQRADRHRRARRRLQDPAPAPHPPRPPHRLDWAPCCSPSRLVPLLLVAEQGREWGWGSAHAIACYVIGVARCRRASSGRSARMGDEAILPLTLFRNRTVGVSSVASVLIGIGDVRRPRRPAAVPADRQGRDARPRPACCCCR